MTDEDTLPYGASGEERAVETAEAEAAGETDADNGTESSGEQAEDGLFADGSETEGQEQQETADAQKKLLPGNWKKMRYRKQRRPLQKKWVWSPIMISTIPTTIRKRN